MYHNQHELKDPMKDEGSERYSDEDVFDIVGRGLIHDSGASNGTSVPRNLYEKVE